MPANDRDGARRAARAWLRQQIKLGRRAARPLIALGLAGTMVAITQAWCAATALAAVLTGAGSAVLALIGFGLLALLRAAFAWAAEEAAARAGAASRRRLRSDALSRLMQAGPALLRARHSGDLATTVVDRVEAVDGLFSRWVPAARLAVLCPALVAIAAFRTDPLAALILLAGGLLVPFGTAAASIAADAAARRQFVALARLQARFLDRIRGIATVVLYGRLEDEACALAEAADELRERMMRVLRAAFISSVILDLAAAAALIALVIRYGLLLQHHELSTPAPALFALLLVPEFFAPLRVFAGAYQDRLHAVGAADELINLPPSPPAAPPREIRNVAARGVTVAFEHVSLTWDPARGPALQDLSFRVPAGETLILAGPSGAGKSSVIEILLGFVRPSAGRVTINGADIADLVPQALSRLTAWIGQRPVLFAGTIRDNIAFARPEASPEEITDAARASRVTDFADALTNGLDTPVGEGGYGLSGGEAQRVAIARAFLKNAPMLLLDEPTAHLDPGTEADVLDSVRRLAVGRTVILASHSSAAHAFSGRRLDLGDGRAATAKVSA